MASTGGSGGGEPLLAIVGPTACGKSEAALELAAALGAEIVSVDSMLVYRGMDVGTAKQTRAERARVPHHLIDIVEPTGKTSALFGGDATGWPISAATTPDHWTTDGTWFTGRDGKLWGYDGSTLTRVDGPGRVTVIAGPAQGVPQAADEITVIGTHLYFELGHDIVALEPLR